MRTSLQDGSNKSLVGILFGSYRRSVLGLLLLHPEKAYHLREISRLTNLPAGSLHRELRLLSGAGLLDARPVGNQIHYQASRQCPIYEELAQVFRKTSGIADVLRDALRPLGDGVEAAFVFGSVAQGREQSSSDVDVFLIGQATFVDVVRALASTQQSLQREVNPVVMTSASFEEKLSSKDPFVSRVMSEPRLMLTGALHVAGKPSEDRPAEEPHDEQAGNRSTARRRSSKPHRRRG